MAKLSLTMVLATVVMLFAARFLVTEIFAAPPIAIIVVDILIMLSATLIAYDVFGMVRELNTVVVGYLIAVFGQLLMDWPLLFGVDGFAREIINYITLFAGTVLFLYGLVKFQEKYNFKAK